MRISGIKPLSVILSQKQNEKTFNFLSSSSKLQPSDQEFSATTYTTDLIDETYLKVNFINTL